MDVSRSGDALRQRETVEHEPPPRWPVVIEAKAETSRAAVRRSAVIRINATRLALAVSVVVVMTMLLADPTRPPDGAVPVEEGETAVTAALTTPAAAPPPHLVIDAVPPSKGSDASLGVSVEGPTEGAVLELIGLPAGWKLSSGRPLGTAGWRLPATDLVDAMIRPPYDFVGAIDLAVELRLADDTLADRQALRREWAQRTPKEPAAKGFGAPLEIGDLCRRGEQLLSSGDIAAARLLLERAARAGNPRAVFMMGATYDPLVLQYLGVHGVPPDVALARSWYEKAKDLGYPTAPRMLGSLAPGDARSKAAKSNQGNRPASE